MRNRDDIFDKSMLSFHKRLLKLQQLMIIVKYFLYFSIVKTPILSNNISDEIKDSYYKYKNIDIYFQICQNSDTILKMFMNNSSLNVFVLTFHKTISFVKQAYLKCV